MKFWFSRVRRSPRVRAAWRVRLVAQFCALWCALCVPGLAWSDEAWRREPMPPGFKVVQTELEGPVYANSAGMTLYRWPQHKLRNGYSGEAAGTPACYDEVQTVTAGLMSPYPPGIRLPDAASRPSCTDLWPPVLAGDEAEETGKWTVIQRRDGSGQWAYDEQPLYTSVRDRQPGDTFGGSRRKLDNDAPAARVPVGPPALLPPGFKITSVAAGRMLTTSKDYALYSFAEDTATSVACVKDCLENWEPVLAPELARAQGEWSILERSPGVRQWVFRGSPLYRFRRESWPWSQLGSDQPGWRNVFSQPLPTPPASFKRQATLAGEVMADRHGKTIYRYQCGEDSADQLACDHPDDTQVYRLAMCGAGDPQRCLEHWPFVLAEDDPETDNRSWSIVTIDPMTGRFAESETPGALRVWAFRDRPVYTFAGDTEPGEVNGGGTGEWRGKRNGLLAFWLRDDFMEGDQ